MSATPVQAAADSARARQVELILESVDTLPTLSPVAAKLLAIGSGEDTDVAEAVKILETDPALSAKMLALCRRADRGLGNRVKTVRHAAVMLGLEAIRSAALSVSVYDLMDRQARGVRRAVDDEMASGAGSPDASGGFDATGFWKHSIAVACAAELIASRAKHLRVAGDEAFLAGLVHDLGKLVLHVLLPRTYDKVVRLAEVRVSDVGVIERALISVDHHTAGKRVAEHWGLPPELHEVIWLHSRPLASLPRVENRNLIAVVTLAEAVCRELHTGWACDFGQPMDPRQLWAELGLSGKGPESIAAPMHEAVAERLRLLGLDAQASSPALLMESLAQANQRLSRMNAVLHERARQSESRLRVLDAVTRFQRDLPRARCVGEVLSIAASSAAGLIGDGFSAALYQPSPAESWQLFRFGADGAVSASYVLSEPPGKRGQQWSLSGLTDATQLSVAMLGLLPWLSEHLADAPDVRRLKLLPLTGAGVGGRQFGPAAVLVNDRDLSDAGLSTALIAPLVGAWSNAVQGASAREAARRLGEHLAESARRLGEVQEEMTRRDSMARLGEMTAGAAHEMNNPLTIISGRAQLLLSRLKSEKDREAAKAIADGCATLTELITSLHDLASPGAPAPSSVSPADLIAQGLRIARERTGLASGVETRSPEGPATLVTDPALVSRALAELIANAMEAKAGAQVRVVAAAGEGGAWTFSVQDHGPGLSPKARQHAFDPFFSERPAGRGRGLGLTRARRFAQLVGGDIHIESTGDGAVATLTLPGEALADAA